MQILAACPGCQRRYELTGQPPGTRFSCSCGGAVTVPEPKAHDAPVVRCCSCGAPRRGGEAVCRYCASEFTLYARDLDALCPGCMARVSHRARFCHSCAAPILAAQASPPDRELGCPACPMRSALTSRRLGRSPVAVLECRTCGGLWVDREVFEVMADRARLGQLPEIGLTPSPGAGEEMASPIASIGEAGPAYRPCVVCGALMNRRNHGGKSRVIVDVCARHGIWFDLHELDRLLRFIREGGEERLRRRQEEEERAEKRQKVLAEGLRPWADPREKGWLSADARSPGADLMLFEGMVAILGRAASWLFRQ